MSHQGRGYSIVKCQDTLRPDDFTGQLEHRQLALLLRLQGHFQQVQRMCEASGWKNGNPEVINFLDLKLLSKLDFSPPALANPPKYHLDTRFDSPDIFWRSLFGVNWSEVEIKGHSGRL